MNAAAVVAEDLVKSFGGDVRALDGVSLEVQPGTVLGLLGPNGAGKTTMVNILTTLLRPDSGRAEVAGFDVVRHPEAVRRRIGLAGQYAAVDENLTGTENLTLVGRLNHMRTGEAKTRAAELLDQFGLSDAGGRTVKTYSGGMRRRLDLAAALVARPPVLFLDEPTTGLDPRSRIDLWKVIDDLVREGTTVLLTTQYLEEADQLADQIAVLDNGRIVADGTPGELKRRMSGGHVQLHFAEPQSLRSAADLLPNATPDLEQLTLQVPGAGSVASLRQVLNELGDARIDVEDLSIHTPDLDDVFFAVTGHASVEPARQQEEAMQR